MSEELIKKSKDAELKAFAQKMIDAQKAEIKMMQDWLKKERKSNYLDPKIVKPISKFFYKNFRRCY
jgi:predicted outer membrane protein